MVGVCRTFVKGDGQRGGWMNGAGFVRASFATSYHKLIEATDRIESFIGKNSLIE